MVPDPERQRAWAHEEEKGGQWGLSPLSKGEREATRWERQARDTPSRALEASERASFLLLVPREATRGF